MPNYGKIEAGVVTQAIVADATFIATLPGTWLELPYGVGIGWNWDGANWTNYQGDPPPTPPAARPRYLLTGSEWVMLFTQDEWAWLKTRRNDGTTAGKQLDKMMDAIRWTDSVNVAAESMDPFYDWMLAQGIPGGQTRIDELRAGV